MVPVLDRNYDTENSEWLTGIQNVNGSLLNMSRVLKNIPDVMWTFDHVMYRFATESGIRNYKNSIH